MEHGNYDNEVVKIQTIVVMMLIIKIALMEFQCLKFELLDVILKKIPHCNFIVLCPNKNLSVIYFLTSLIFYFREVQETLYLFLLLSHLDSFHLSMKACDTFFFFEASFYYMP